MISREPIPPISPQRIRTLTTDAQRVELAPQPLALDYRVIHELVRATPTSPAALLLP
jgi:hypothetical protein